MSQKNPTYWVRSKEINETGVFSRRPVPAKFETREEALALYRALGEKQEIAMELNGLSWTLFMMGEYPEARALAEERLALSRDLGDAMVAELFFFG